MYISVGREKVMRDDYLKKVTSELRPKGCVGIISRMKRWGRTGIEGFW